MFDLVKLSYVKQKISTSAPQVTPQVRDLLANMQGDMSREELQQKLALKDRENFRKAYLSVALEMGLIERTLPEKPKSKHQKYRLTQKGIDTRNLQL